MINIFFITLQKISVMIEICNKIQDDNKSKEELLENVIIEKTSYDDAYQIIDILSNCFRNRKYSRSVTTIIIF